MSSILLCNQGSRRSLALGVSVGCQSLRAEVSLSLIGMEKDWKTWSPRRGRQGSSQVWRRLLGDKSFGFQLSESSLFNLGFR